MKLNSPLGKPLTPADLEAAKNLKSEFNKRKKALGLTQESAAKKLNMSQPSVNKYLNGKIALNVKSVLAWANILNVNPTLIRPDFDSLLTATRIFQKIPLKCILGNNGTCTTQVDRYVHISTLTTTEGINALKLETKDIPGYFHGQIVTFDVEAPGNKDRHVIAHTDDDSYSICEYVDGKYVNVATKEVVGGDEVTTYNIVGTAFVD